MDDWGSALTLFFVCLGAIVAALWKLRTPPDPTPEDHDDDIGAAR